MQQSIRETMDEEQPAPSMTERSAAVEDYEAAERYVNGLIFGPPSPAPGTPQEVIRARAVARLERLRRFLAFIGDPHLRYRTIHVGGTSGKGSTTVMIGSILQAAGLRTGVHVSPYLQVATEKLQIDGRIVPASRYRALVESMHEKVDAWVASGRERPNYGEFWVAMMFEYFAEERVDAAVVEVGAGGRFDVTNVIQPEVVAITSVGLDHMTSLGSTIPEIAWHKAGIIKPGVIAATTVTDPRALPAIEEEARLTGAPLLRVRKDVDWTDVTTDRDGTSFLDVASSARLRVPLAGEFQAANASLAIAVCRAFDPERAGMRAIESGLAATRFPGRIEIVQNSPLVVLDGAHNPEKMASMVGGLEMLFPKRRIVAVLGVLESKNYREMLDILGPHIDALVATAPQVLAKPPVTASMLGERAAEVVSTVVVEQEPLQAVERALGIAEPDDLVLVTGSLYLIGNVRERWYPSARILEQGTCWPSG